MKNRLFSKANLLSILLLFGCSESVLDKVNPNGSLPLNYYSNQSELTQGINGVYAVPQGFNMAAREWWFVHDLRSDDMATGGGQLEVPRAQILDGSYTYSNSVMQSVWDGLNRTVLRANEVIDGSVNAKTTPADFVNRVVAEAKFLRAWAYSDLVLLWGAVPMHRHVPTTLTSASSPRMPVDSIYNFMITDLNAIQQYLPVSYSGNDVGRVTKGAAQALLGRVLMAKGDYAGAKAALDPIVSSGAYQLMANYSDNHLEETPFNKESVFEIGFFNNNMNWNNGDGDNGGGVNEGNAITQELSCIGWRNLVPSDGLLAEYETVANGYATNDPRFAASFYMPKDTYNNGASTVDTSAVQGTKQKYNGVKQKISWKKYTAMYKNNSTFYTGQMNLRIIRYAEVLANLAECENELGNTATALGYLNQIRNRVSMPNYPTANFPCSNKAQTFAAIQHERRVEFANEQIRNRDIVRWRKNGKLTSEPISYFTANKYELMPIPQEEFATNGALTNADQNPGY